MIAIFDKGFAHEVATDHKIDDFLKNIYKDSSYAEKADWECGECDSTGADQDGIFVKIEVRLDFAVGTDVKKGCDNESQNQGQNYDEYSRNGLHFVMNLCH